MTNTETQLLNFLSDIHGTGKFSTSGSPPFFFPDIAVHGEKLGFPLSPVQAQHLISQAEAAPYGKGEETVRA